MGELTWDLDDDATAIAVVASGFVLGEDGGTAKYRLVRTHYMVNRNARVRWVPEHDAEIGDGGPRGPWVNLSAAKAAIARWHFEQLRKWGSNLAEAIGQRHKPPAIAAYPVIGGSFPRKKEMSDHGQRDDGPTDQGDEKEEASEGAGRGSAGPTTR